MSQPTSPAPANSVEPGQEEALLAQGRAYYAQGEYQEALSCLHLAYDVCLSQTLADQATQSRVAEVANDIGVVYTVQERWDEAVKWLGEAQQRFVQDNNIDGEAQTLGNLGSMYRVRGDYRQAAAYLQLSADRFHLVGDNEKRAMSLRALSIVRLRQLRPLWAVAAYCDALACRPNPNLAVKLLIKLLSLPFRLHQG
jgi:tetratricopeptide (TPR) repeat protein